MYENIELPEMCNWCIEDDTGWFVACSVNVLFKYDRKAKVLSAVSAIPVEAAGEFRNPYCIKSGDLVYCLPGFESSIWYYNLRTAQWGKISMCDEGSIAVNACMLGEYKGIYYFFSMGFKRIYGLNLKTGMIVDSYDVDVKEETNIYYFNGVLVDDCVYLVVGGSSIYEISLETWNQEKYDLDSIDDIVQKINFGGGFFWLIGYKRDIYRWNREDNILEKVTEFPAEFALYDFVHKSETVDFDNQGKDLVVYCGIHYLNGKVWLVPQSGNKMLYYDQEDGKVNVFEIQDEEETLETLDLSYRHIASKFFLMYVREERYLGVYSYKNKIMIEIDSINMTCEKLSFIVDEYSLEKLSRQDFYESGNQFTYLIYYARMNDSDSKLQNADTKSIGERIYREVSR